MYKWNYMGGKRGSKYFKNRSDKDFPERIMVKMGGPCRIRRLTFKVVVWDVTYFENLDF